MGSRVRIVGLVASHIALCVLADCTFAAQSHIHISEIRENRSDISISITAGCCCQSDSSQGHLIFFICKVMQRIKLLLRIPIRDSSVYTLVLCGISHLMIPFRLRIVVRRAGKCIPSLPIFRNPDLSGFCELVAAFNGISVCYKVNPIRIFRIILNRFFIIVGDISSEVPKGSRSQAVIAGYHLCAAKKGSYTANSVGAQAFSIGIL